MPMSLQTPTRILVGNALFVACCAFYIAWWVLRFRPANPVMGVKSGWLLIPAAVAGIVGVVLIISGLWILGSENALFWNWYVIVGWILAYVIAYIVTRWFFDRPVTSELMLITGWAALALAEVNTLYGSQILSRALTVVLIVIIGVVLAACLVCYVLYYRLDAQQGFIDGMIPLLLTGLFMAGVSVPLLANLGG